jgi:hypothetical protein
MKESNFDLARSQLCRERGQMLLPRRSLHLRDAKIRLNEAILE